jgi:multidrug resistance efflux pump
MVQQNLNSDDNIADSILQSARRKYAAMKRLEMKKEIPLRSAQESATAAQAANAKKTQTVQDRKAIDAVLKSGSADKQTLVSRLEAAIANHKLSTRGLVEAVREAQKV